jgi:hypothetical protein
MKPYKLILILPLLAVLSACVAFTNDHWVHPEKKTWGEYNDDLMDCLHQWMQLTPMSDTPYLIPEDHSGPLGTFMINTDMHPEFEAECLEKKGWVRKDKK